MLRPHAPARSAPRVALRGRLLPAVAAGLLVLLGVPFAPTARGDVVRTTDGLVIEGEVTRAEDGSCVVRTAEGAVELEAGRIESITPGEGPRTRYARRAAELAQEGDAAAWYRLALETEAADAPDLARQAYAEVVRLDPEHAAARRAMGQQLVDGDWESEAVAARRRGLVLYQGAWRLPAEVEALAQEEAVRLEVPSGDARIRATIRTLVGDDPVLAHAARVALAGVEPAHRVRAALQTLYDGDPAVRRVSARLLGELGDESALRPLILSGARDTDAQVRREAVLAAQSFGHDDTAIPFVRALGSENDRLVANAAEAIATLEEERAAAYIVKRLESHGSSTRNMVAFLNQVSYVRDYDVEIAQASNIANPDVSTIQEGVIMDVRVLDAGFTKTWVEAALVNALSRLAGQPLRDKAEALAWYRSREGELPTFPTGPSKRRRAGSVIGVPVTR